VGDYKLLSGMEMYIVSSLQFLQDELKRIILDSLLEFIRKSASTLQRGTDDWARGMGANEILTAALVRGVNVPNHEMTFQSSSNQLQQSCAGQTHFGPNNLSGTPGKKRTSFGKDMQQHPPILVIFIDLEAFNPRVLQDFIICRGEKIGTIQHMLPQSISFLLCIELFQSLTCTLHLTTVIDKPINLHISSTVLQVLVRIFLHHDFSVRNFIKDLQLALLEHFHSQPLSVLCCKEAAALGHATELSHRDVERIQQLPSFTSVESAWSDQRWTDLSVGASCLDFQIRELHISCLEKNVWENEEHVSAMQLRMIAKDELVAALQKCAEILKPGKSKKMSAALLQLEDLLAKVAQSDRKKGLQKKTDLFQLQKVTFFLLCCHETPPQRHAIQTALSNPYLYLKNENLRTEDGTISNAAPDICIVYKLHMECGRLINLYHWQEAYATVVSAAEVDELKRYPLTVGSFKMLFLGFVKSTKQKSDHVS
uniref:Origin recognition complex subunit 3 n=1 Tax=Oncorhynchus kisutch TaxID=8019 RepID=A0A8C7DEZ3_ONCKI